MSRTVHGAYVTITVIVLYCGLCSCLQFNQEHAKKKFDNELDTDSFHLVEPLETNKNDVEVIPEDDVLFATIKTKQTHDGEKEKEDGIITLRKKRQAYQGHTQLYPQLPTAPTYNPYQPQPNYNPPGQSPYQQGQQPWSSTNHTSFSPGHPPPQGYNPNTGYNQNQGTHNYSQPGSQYPGNYNNQNGGTNHPNPTYNPFTSQFATVNTTYPQMNYNASSTHYPQNPSNGKYPSYNQTSNYPHNAGSVRPPNASYPGYSNSSYNKYPGVGPSTPHHGQYPHNPTTPYNTNRNSSLAPYPHNPTSPYSNNATSSARPNQWQHNYPGSNGQYPTNTNFNPNYPSQNARNSSFGTHNSSFGQYPSSPYANNATSHSQPNYPGSNGQYPNTYPGQGYPSPNSATNSNNPNYPQNNFYYPQVNNSAYDPRKVPPQKFAYH